MRRRLPVVCLLLLTLALAHPRAQSPGPWRVLFDGTSLDAWRGYRSETVPEGWVVQDGALTKSVSTNELITKDQFGDFELEFEWRVSTGADGGVFYRGTEEESRLYWTAAEYQVLDDERAEDNKTRLTCAGAAYGLYPTPAGHLKPVGEWNTARIVVRGPHVEHWTNGEKLVTYELWNEDWTTKVAASKFKAWPKYGRATRGHIGLQGGHAEMLAYRHIRIREVH